MADDIGHLVLLKEEVEDEWEEEDCVENPIPDGAVNEEPNTDVSGGADPLCGQIELEETALPRVKEEPLDDVTDNTTTPLDNEEMNDLTLDGSSSEYSSNDDDFYDDELVSSPKKVKKSSGTRGRTPRGDKRNSGIQKKRHACDICDYVCGLASDLRRHTRSHTGEKPFKCEVCGSRFTQAAHVKVHMRTHTGEKQFACDACEFKCNRASNLKTHKIRAHSGLKPFSCEACGQRFKLRGDVDRHALIHTGEKPYPCDFCDAKFTQAGHLRAHMRIHTGEKPFACDLCDYKCTRTKTLKNHVAKAHSQDVS